MTTLTPNATTNRPPEDHVIPAISPYRDLPQDLPQVNPFRTQTANNRPSVPLDARARKALIEQHLPLVRKIARRIHARLPRSVSIDDLVQEGSIGLIEAIDRYDEHRLVPLALFARRRITGAILDRLRATDWVPRTVRRRADRLNTAKERLQRKHGREPSEAELAEALQLDVGALDRYQRYAEVRTVVSMETPLGPNGDARVADTLSTDDDCERDQLDDELRRTVIAGIDHLPAKEQIAVRGFFLEGRALTDIGAELGVSESRVSQLHRMGVNRLRFRVRELLTT